MLSIEDVNTSILVSYKYFNQYVYDISYFLPQQIFCSKDAEKDIIALDGTIKDLPTNGGELILPHDEIPVPFIFCDINHYDGTLNFCKMLFHEFIHVYDFYNLVAKYFDFDWNAFQQSSLIEAFRIYTEFHASSLEYEIVYNMYDLINNTTEFENEMNLYRSSLDEYIQNFHSSISTSHIIPNDWHNTLGHIYVFDKKDNTVNSNKSLINNFLPMMFPSLRQREIAKNLYNHCCLLRTKDNLNLEDFQKLQDLYKDLFRLE